MDIGSNGLLYLFISQNTIRIPPKKLESKLNQKCDLRLIVVEELVSKLVDTNL